MRMRPGSRPTSCAKGRSGTGATYGLEASGPWIASSITALSRTLMLTTWPQENPAQPSPRSGPIGLRARVGFNPNTPDSEAGKAIEPAAPRARAVRRRPRGVREVPLVSGRAEQARLGGRHQSEFRTGALSEDRHA